MKSQNGWVASPNKRTLNIVSPLVPGTDVRFPQGVRGGHVETVLMYLASRFHREVEPLRKGWCWGYHYKTIGGSGVLSNHASGTAIDLNAPKHPMGQRGTFKSRQVKAIRRILDEMGGVVRWGGDYRGRPDEMHFEIIGSATQVARAAIRLKSDNDDWLGRVIVSLPLLSTKLVKQQNAHTKTWQGVLNARGYKTTLDGYFGPQTEADTKKLQKKYGAELIDGKVGPETWTIGLTLKDLV